MRVVEAESSSRDEENEGRKAPVGQWGLIRVIAGCALLFLCLWAPIETAQLTSATLPTSHLDGAFQTFNGLSRLSSGQLPGRDFFPYIGVGPLAMLWPTYALHGANLGSSVFAATLTTMVLFQMAFALIAVLVFRSKSWLFALTAALVPSVAVDLMGGSIVKVDALLELSAPGNSLRPIRAFAPYLVVAVVMLVTHVTKRPCRRAILLGSLLAPWPSVGQTTTPSPLPQRCS